MTTFRFLHAADLHLGSPFKGLALKDQAVAERFSAATRTAFQRLVDRAIEEAVDFVVIAGDIYDGEWRDSSIGLFFNQQVARLSRVGIRVFMLRGNHDALSVVTRSVPLPDTVKEFGTRKPETFRIDALKVALHGQGFTDRAANDNLVLDYPAPVPGWFNIGVLHTSLTGRPGHDNYAPCTVEDLRSRGYDYWALGHVHAFEVVSENPFVIFPGNLQGRSVREQGPRGAVIVSVDDGRVTSIERVIVDDARWHAATLALDMNDTVDSLLERAEQLVDAAAAETGGLPLALRLHITGNTTLRFWLHAEREDVHVQLQAICHRVHADIWLEKVSYDLAPPAETLAITGDMAPLLDAVATDPALGAAAAGLVRDISARLPPGAGAELIAEDLATLIAEARDIVLARTGAER